MVAPGKFTLYTCDEIATQAKQVAARQSELERLTAKAGQDATGKLVSTLAYRPDYLTARGEMIDVRQAAAEKKCNTADIDKAVADGTRAGAEPGAILTDPAAPRPTRTP